MFINHIKYIRSNKATGKLKNLYKHINLNFGKLAEPFVLHSSNVELTAGVWAMLYETVLVDGEVKRSLKEAIATIVSEINKCPYCVDAHSIMIFGTEKGLQNDISIVKEGTIKPKTKDEKIIQWALRNLDFDNSVIQNPPFIKEEAPEIIGTAVLFHYLTRMVTLFAGNSPFPTTKMRGLLIKVASFFIFAKAINKKKIAGECLIFLNEISNQDAFVWAAGSPNIRKAFQYLKHHSEYNIQKILSSELIALLKNISKKPEMLQPGFGNKNLGNFLNEVKPTEREMAEFSFFTMFEPYKITEKCFHALRQRLGDEEILQLAAFAGMLVAENIGEKLNENIGI